MTAREDLFVASGLLLQLISIPCAQAQGATFDSLRADAQSSYIWRGYDRGGIAIGVDGSGTLLGGADARRFQTVVDAEVRGALTDRHTSIVTQHAREAVSVLYHVSGEGERVWASVAALQFPGSDVGPQATYEIGGGAMIRIPALPERHPTVLAEAFRDISGYHATWVRAGLRFDYEFGNRRALFITPSQHWSSYSASGDRPSVGFAPSATEVEIRADFDEDPATAGNVFRRIEPFLLAVWSHRNKDPNVFGAGLRLTLVF